MASVASEVTRILRLVEELNIPIQKHFTPFVTINVLYSLEKITYFMRCQTHIEIDCYFIREKVFIEDLLHLSYLPTKKQMADLLLQILPPLNILRNLLAN